MNARFSHAKPLSRRKVLKVVTAGLVASLAPVLPAFAETDKVLMRIDEATTVGEVIRTIDPDHWSAIHPDVQRVLDEAPYGVDGSQPLARVSGTVTLRATDGVGSSYFEGSYQANEVCPTVACYVTYSRNGNIVARRGPSTANYTTWVSISGTITGLSAGAYRAVITGYPMQPPPGGTIEYSQRAVTVNVI